MPSWKDKLTAISPSTSLTPITMARAPFPTSGYSGPMRRIVTEAASFFRHIGGAPCLLDERPRKVARPRNRRLQLFARERIDFQPRALHISKEARVLRHRHEGAAQLGHVIRWSSRRRQHRTPDQRGRREQLEQLPFLIVAREIDHAGDAAKVR